MNHFINMLDDLFVKKVPALPEGAKKFIVNIAPYLAILGILFLIPAVSVLLGLSALTTGPAMYYGGYGMGYGSLMIIAIGSVVNIVLYIIAIPGLFRRTTKGWTFIFYAFLVGLVETLLTFNIFGLIFGFIIGGYILFQVRSYYTAVGMTPPSMPPAGGAM